MAEKFTTALSQWTNTFTGLVTRDFAECGVEYSDYAKKCAMSAMTSIYQLCKDGGKDPNSLDRDSIRSAVGQAASLQLNADAYPAECYFQTRKKKTANGWTEVVEMGIMGAGNDALLNNFGSGIDKVYPAWIVHEGDDFTYPTYSGLEVEPPKWTPHGESDRVVRVVYPIKQNGIVQYFIAERESAKVNLFAHIRNNMLNETFGICENRYKATEKQKAEIKAKKQEIFDALSECKTLDEMLKCELALPYISQAWLESTESMVARKLQNNIVKKIPKNYDAMARRSFMELDETYKASREEIEEEANSEPFVIDVEGEVIEE